jgi:hypothetical protein
MYTLRKGRGGMRILKSIGMTFCAVAAFMFLATATEARAGEPHYLRALSNLRTARDYLQYDQNPVTAGERGRAVGEIIRAIEEVKRAAWDDGKNTEFAPPAGPVKDPWKAVKEAEKYVKKAADEVSHGVDPAAATGVRDRAMMHISAAQNILRDMHHYWGDR